MTYKESKQKKMLVCLFFDEKSHGDHHVVGKDNK